VLLKQLKTQKLAKELEELKEKLKLLKSDRSGSKDQGSSSEEPSNQIYN